MLLLRFHVPSVEVSQPAAVPQAAEGRPHHQYLDMVDFRKQLTKTTLPKRLVPTEIYDHLDRESGTGPLRPAQEAVLADWHGHRRGDRDVIIKLQTGAGKTLIGLLVLQSKINETQGRAIYLCPNHFLVNQTLTQAKQFGISCVPVDADGELPGSFLDGGAVLVAPVQKLFNGRTKFGLGPTSIDIDYVVLDDAHACIDAIKDATLITLDRDQEAYQQIVELFAPDLEAQGVGTFAEMRAQDSGAFLPIPYWAWTEHHAAVAQILAKHTDRKPIKFAWPLLRDRLAHCVCVVSGRMLTIAPYLPPLNAFGSYWEAKHRVFMSATVADDSFLIKGLGVRPDVVKTPLTFAGETWSGEKMILIPSMVDAALTDSEIVKRFGPPNDGRKIGVVALVPSFQQAKDWEGMGAVVATSNDIDVQVARLHDELRETMLVIVNRYDGIDLPDSSCRVLILDGKPFSEGLLDQYIEASRPGSEVVATRIARVVEQGLGRAVRGEKDYCVVLLTGADLVRAVRSKESRTFYSEQTRKQIELGIEVSTLAAEDIGSGGKAGIDALIAVMSQCLRRDESWKQFHRERMDEIEQPGAAPKMLNVFAAELEAEESYQAGAADDAVRRLQKLLDTHDFPPTERGWYLQEMGRYRQQDPLESTRLQHAAHGQNRYLLRPRDGVKIAPLTPIAQRRAQAIITWFRSFDSGVALSITLDGLLGDLRFGARAESFETAIDQLGQALGFATERPDREWKEGPDNLWAMRDGVYLLIECKSEVAPTRKAINKHESGQINNACAWFAREYPGASANPRLIIPTRELGKGAGFNAPVQIMRAKHLQLLGKSARGFFGGLAGLDAFDVTEGRVQELLEIHRLSVEAILTDYAEAPREP
jgi:replicative superfamily II helicase